MMDVVVASLAGVSLSGLRVVIDFLRERRRQRALHEDKLDRILESPDLEVLGTYLDNDLGAIDVGGYATEADARRRVDRVLGRLRAFLGPVDLSAQPTAPDAKTPPAADAETPSELSSGTGLWADLPQDVRKRLDGGDEWAALVLLRSRLERQLRDYLRALGEEVPEHTAPSRLVARLAERRILAPDATKGLTQAMAVMNRAAHGVEISGDDVLATLRTVADAVKVLRQSTLQGNQKTVAEAYGINEHNQKSPPTRI